MGVESPRLPRIFTIPASVPFLPTLVRALVDGELVPGFVPGTDPLALGAATLYLPTRRACRLARDVFLDVLDSDAALLPRIVPIGDIDEDEIAFAEIATGTAAADALDLPPALGGLPRRMLLAQLVLLWAQRLKPAPGDQPLVVGTPAAALALADDLARLMDDLATREVDWKSLDGLVPDHVDHYWQLTLDFLKIARERWPEILKERQAIEPAERRDRLINAEAARLAAASHGPVIAAGSTGSMPATAKLLATIARLPHGAVVLPGLDTDLDDDAWELIGAGGDDERDDNGWPVFGHPQFAMHALLARIGIGRNEVASLRTAAAHGREVLLSETLRPARATDRWQDRLREVDAQLTRGITGVAMIEAANAEEEALAIAVALREAVEQPDTTAALVTPDRALARRVVAALGRWNVAADDSGGDALADTAAGVLARLVAELALDGVAPVALLAVMKHALFRLGSAAGAHAFAVAALERAILRGPRPRAGSAGLAHALATFREELRKLRARERSEIHAGEPRASVADPDLAAAAVLVERLAAALAPLERVAGSASLPFRTFAAAHRETIANLSRDEAGDSVAFADTDGTALARFFDEVAQDGAADLAVAPRDYGETFATAMADRVVRRPGAPGARVHIYGPLEARLTESRRVILGGLAEGVWPPEPRGDPWLNRPMRLQLGLDLPERRIGLSAHDFAQMLGAPEVILSRAAKLGGAPAVASRFVQRLAAVAGEARWKAAVARGASICRDGTRSRPHGRAHTNQGARAASAARRAPDRARGHRDRALAARSLHDLRQAHPAPRPSRSGRHATLGGRSRQRHPRGGRSLRADLPGRAARRRPCRADADRTRGIRPARRFSRGARPVVAALCAHCALARGLGARAPSRPRRDARRNSRRGPACHRRAAIPALRPRRPYRAARWRRLCDPRFQNR